MINVVDCDGIFLYGASGHAKVITDIIELINVNRIHFLIDDNPALQDSLINGYRIVGGGEKLHHFKNHKKAFVSIGRNTVREAIAQRLITLGYNLATLIHPRACVARGCGIGFGTVVMAGSIVNSGCRIGNNVIINTNSTIEHDCNIESGVHIAPGVTLCGGVSVGKGAFLGVGVSVVPNVQIGENVMAAAGTVVYKNVSAGMRIIGVRNEW